MKYRVTRTRTAKVNGKDIAGDFITVCELHFKNGDPRSRNSLKRQDRIQEEPIANFYTVEAVRGWLKEQGIDGRRVTWVL